MQTIQNMFGIAGLLMFCGGGVYEKDLLTLVTQSSSSDSSISKPSINTLRELGPTGLEALLRHLDFYNSGGMTYGAPLDQVPQAKEDFDRLRKAIDMVAQQKDADLSRLYWYTDFETAKRAAQTLNKPILSLRLLGRLDEEFSCANSRFFRTALYPNAEVSKYLREHFILHWQSVRPVPKVTIDFGDGRKLERTLTGNSIHYVLDRNGDLVDALPGLYGPKAFLRSLKAAEGIAQRKISLHVVPKNFVTDFHRMELVQSQKQWEMDLRTIDLPITNEMSAPQASTDNLPTALEATIVTATKMKEELPTLRSLSLEKEASMADEKLWEKIAARHLEDSRLDGMSHEMIKRKEPDLAEKAMRATMSKALVENPLLKFVQNFEHSIAEDTVRNEYLLHSKIHRWFMEGVEQEGIDKFNERVYAELFLTPSSDPWLGLNPENVYCALEDRGVVK